MATRAEQARARAERSPTTRKKTERKPAPRRKPADPDEVIERKQVEARAASSGRYAGGVTAARNVRVDRGDHATHELEDSGSGRPSRKSTRKAAHRAKPDAQLHRRAIRKTHAPGSRAARKRS
jgi:hypothetical protein